MGFKIAGSVCAFKHTPTATPTRSGKYRIRPYLRTKSERFDTPNCRGLQPAIIMPPRFSKPLGAGNNTLCLPMLCATAASPSKVSIFGRALSLSYCDSCPSLTFTPLRRDDGERQACRNAVHGAVEEGFPEAALRRVVRRSGGCARRCEVDAAPAVHHRRLRHYDLRSPARPLAQGGNRHGKMGPARG